MLASGPAAAIQPSARGRRRPSVQAGHAAERPQLDRGGGDAEAPGHEAWASSCSQDRRRRRRSRRRSRRRAPRDRQARPPAARPRRARSSGVRTVVPASRPISQRTGHGGASRPCPPAQPDVSHGLPWTCQPRRGAASAFTPVVGEHDGRAVAAARAPDPGPRERRGAGEVEPGHRRLVAGQLRVGGCGARRAARRRSSWRGRPGRWKSRSYTSGVIARQSTIEPRQPVRTSRRPARASAAARSSRPAAADGAYGVSSTSRLTARAVPAGATTGRASDGTLTSIAGRSRIRRRRRSAVGVVHLGDRRGDRVVDEQRSSLPRSTRRLGHHGVDLRLVAVLGVLGPRHRSTSDAAPAGGVAQPARRTSAAGRTADTTTGAVISVPSSRRDAVARSAVAQDRRHGARRCAPCRRGARRLAQRRRDHAAAADRSPDPRDVAHGVGRARRVRSRAARG